MPYDLDSEVKVIMVPAQTVAPVTDIPLAEWTDYKNRVVAIEGLGLVDLSDVDLDGLADGMVITWDDGDSVWKPTAMLNGLESGRDNTGDIIMEDVRSVVVGTGLEGFESGSIPDGLVVRVLFGTTANTAARGNHTHTQPLPVRVTTAPSGYMSGGTRNIGSTSVTLASGITYIVEAAVYGQLRGADPGASYYTVNINIDGNTYTSPGGSDGFWCVQGVPDKVHWEHERQVTGTGASIPVSATIAYHSGAGFNVDRMYLRVRARPNR